jgi:hypothetical protein
MTNMTATADVALTRAETELLLKQLAKAAPQEQNNIVCQDLIRKLKQTHETLKFNNRVQLVKGKAKK